MNKVYNDINPFDLSAKVLSENASPEEIKLLENWKSHNPDNKRLFEESKLSWDKSGSFEIELTQEKTDESWIKLQKKINTNKNNVRPLSFKKFIPLSAAAAVLVILLMSWWMFPTISGLFSGENTADWLSVVNESAELKTVQMPDGSTIILNKNTTLRYPEKFEKRQVELLGEAFFKVTYNPKNPFRIKAGPTEIEVLGTAFNVRRIDNSSDISVMVESGKVNFKIPDAEPILLLAGKGAIYSTDTKKAELRNDINASAWRSKMFKFQNTSVKDVIYSLNNVYGIKVELSSETMLDCRFNGVFDNVSPENILHALTFSIGAELKYEDNIYKITGEGCNN